MSLHLLSCLLVSAGFTLILSDLYGRATLRMGFLSYIYIPGGVDGLSEVVVGSITVLC